MKRSTLVMACLIMAVAGVHEYLIGWMIEEEIAASLLAANPTLEGFLLALAFITMRLFAMVAVPFMMVCCVFTALSALSGRLAVPQSQS